MTTAALVIALFLQTLPAARTVKVNGDVEVIRPGETVAAKVGDVVRTGDRMHAAKESSLILDMESGVTIQLRSDSTLELKNLNGAPVALLVEGSANVRSFGKTARIETKYGPILGTESVQEFDVSYNGEMIQVLLVAGGIRAEVSEPSKIVFKNAYDFGVRVYEAGSISPGVLVEKSGTTVIVYPNVVEPRQRGKRSYTIDGPDSPPIPPK